MDYVEMYKRAAHVVSFSITLASLSDMSEKYSLHYLVQSK